MSVISVIGSGFSGLSAACYLSLSGHEVHVFEKNSDPGGRARQMITSEGFVFDMGPSWYWMPDVFEKFFNDFGYGTSDFYKLEKLSPAFDVVFGKDDIMQVPNDFDELRNLFESMETGSSKKLVEFMEEAEFKYKAGIENLVYKPGLSLFEFADADLIKGVIRLQVFSSFSSHIRKYFKNQKLLTLMEFPVLFLGAIPEKTPALYSLMNYAGLKLGTYYPQGGFGEVIKAFVKIAVKNGVRLHFNSPVEKINSFRGEAKSMVVNGEIFECDGIIASADYHHVESKLLNVDMRNYYDEYWKNKTLAPSCLVYYLGLKKKIYPLNHHTLFFDENFYNHSIEIYKKPKWPDKPLFYACCPSKTDSSVAPRDCENLFLLMPIAPGLEDTTELRERYFHIMAERIESVTNYKIKENIIYKRSYCVNDFISDYNSYKGNAYGLANTLMQTAILKPKMINYRISNLIYTGQLTVPGPGVPPSIISGKIASELLIKRLKRKKYEITV